MIPAYNTAITTPALYDLERYSVIGLRPPPIDVDSHEWESAGTPPPAFTLSESTVQGLGNTAAAFFGNAYPDPNQVRCLVTSVRYVMDRMVEGARDWSKVQQGESVGTRARAMTRGAFVGAVPWINLLAGEGLALVPQGILQANGASNSVSFMAYLVSSFGIEWGAATLVANENERRHPPDSTETPSERRARIIKAVGEAFWLGGAWGVESSRLNNRQKYAPIAGYMVFGTGLGIAAEQNDLASTLIESPAFFGALLVLAGMRTFNGVAGLEGVLDRMARRTSGLLDRILGRIGRGGKLDDPSHDMLD